VVSNGLVVNGHGFVLGLVCTTCNAKKGKGRYSS